MRNQPVHKANAISAKAAGLRRRLRAILLGSVSLCVTAALVGFVISPADPAFAFDKVVVSAAPHGIEVVYGRATQPNGSGFAGARVTVSYTSAGKTRVEATALTAANGTYRTTFSDVCRTYRVTIAALVSEAVTSNSISVYMCRSFAYRVNAHLKSTGHFIFFPVSNY